MQLVYFSPVPWASFAQRPHKFVEWFHARCGQKILWVDPYPTRLPKFGDFIYLKKIEHIKSANIPGWLQIIQPTSLPIEPLPGVALVNHVYWKNLLQEIDLFISKGHSLIVIGKPTELALQALRLHPEIPSIYDAMDDFPAFYQGLSKRSMKQREDKVTNAVSRILVSSTMLADRFNTYRTKMYFALNACDINILSPVNRVAKKTGKVILGYVGTIGRWFDWSSVIALANANPAMCIRLVGPIYVSPPKYLPQNIELLPACDHVTAIKIMQTFTVGLIPFICNELTASVDPIKYYEYRALGLPIISSSFGEMALRHALPGLFFMDKHDNLADLVQQASTYEYGVEEIKKFRAENSWEVRFDESRVLSSL